MGARVCPSDGIETLPVAVLEAEERELAPLTVVGGRYRIEGLIGRGAMGAVYEATQLSMHRAVALKVLLGDGLRDPVELRRFYREAQAASRLEHPNVVQIYDFGFDEASRRPFIAMELVRGETLRQRLQAEGPMPPARAAQLLAPVARALVAAHAKGVVHRDLKPDNIMVRTLPDGTTHTTVLDFGVAKTLHVAPGPETSTGQVVGTPRYMSPEQVRGEPVHPASDLYALGCVLHELLTGTPPFVGDDPVELMFAHVGRAAPALDPGRFDPGLRALQAALLAKRPEERPDGAAEVARILGAVEAGAPTPLLARPAPGIDVGAATVRRSPAPPPRGRVWPAMSVGLVALAGALTWALWPEAAVPPPASVSPPSAADTPALEHPDGPPQAGPLGTSLASGPAALRALEHPDGPPQAGPLGTSLASGPAALRALEHPDGPPQAGPLGTSLASGPAALRALEHPDGPPQAGPLGTSLASGPAAQRALEHPDGPPQAGPLGTSLASGPAALRALEHPDGPPQAGPLGAAPTPAPSTRTVTLQSLPSGARVLGDGRVLGRTPLELVVPQAGLQVRLDHAGYRPQDLLLRADEPPPVVHLRAQPRRVVPELAPR